MRQTGDLRSVVRLYRREANIDTGDGQVDYGFLWRSYAEVYHLSDKALAAGGAEYSSGVLSVILRTPLQCRLLPGLRVVYDGGAYEVTEVLPDTPRRGFSKLRCVLTEMVGSGVHDL